jgi:hypothetical protein
LKSTSVTGEEEEYTPTQNGFLKNYFFPESTPFSVKDIHIQSVFDSMPHFHFRTVVELNCIFFLFDLLVGLIPRLPGSTIFLFNSGFNSHIPAV